MDTTELVSPVVFQRYTQEHTQLEKLAKQENQQNWQWVKIALSDCIASNQGSEHLDMRSHRSQKKQGSYTAI
ncbi:conjugal transfer nickase/helicase domain-containing protein [Halomonas sp. MES3-P3E]|uniref:conjugal transfer nickase/helicase domain-containing protein n=1 Tax=Halomonas sp. MES3-P3E TaxID=2058321 RepID=UPI001E440307|nr:DNA-binding domain-containing protein [Halomonas sp. MES3-P3E]